MKKFHLPMKIMFSDCDPAQLVFYPKYFQWFDVATQRMFNELGMEWSKFWPDRGISGLPLVDASATFKGPARMDDEIEIVSWVEEWREFCNSIAEARDPIGSGDDGLAALRIALAAYEAEKLGKILPISNFKSDDL